MCKSADKIQKRNINPYCFEQKNVLCKMMVHRIAHRTIYSRQRTGAVGSNHARHPTHHQPQPELISWLRQRQYPPGRDICGSVEYQSAEKGWGFVADRDIQPNEVVLRFPLRTAFQSREDDENDLPWSISMAKDVLEDLYKGDESENSVFLASLPPPVNLPWLSSWSSAHLAELQYGEIQREIRSMQYIRDAALEYLDQYDPDDVLWALSMVHSRSFVAMNRTHLWVPGICLCNHRDTPNAHVQIQLSPDATQGVSAVEEIAPVGTPGESLFQLVSSEYIAAGTEISIRYGTWPNDVFLLYFGWVPDENPYDDVVLYQNVQEIVDDVVVPEKRHAVEVDDLCVEDASWTRFVATKDGVDGRLIHIMNNIIQIDGICSEPIPTVSSLIRNRCEQMLERELGTTSLFDDEHQLESCCSSSHEVHDSNKAMALRFRHQKKKLLKRVIDTLS